MTGRSARRHADQRAIASRSATTAKPTSALPSDGGESPGMNSSDTEGRPHQGGNATRAATYRGASRNPTLGPVSPRLDANRPRSPRPSPKICSITGWAQQTAATITAATAQCTRAA